MRVFITGISSFLGQHLLGFLPAEHKICGAYFSNPVLHSSVITRPLDLRDPAAVTHSLGEFSPDTVVHIAAMSVVSDCERAPQKAEHVNATGTKNIALFCSKKNIRLIHISTDMIFDGEIKDAYSEEDPPHPVTVYGKTKCKAEEIVRELCPKAVILRPALIYGAPRAKKKGFLFWMQEEAKARGKVHLFSDQYRSPVFVGDICRLILKFMEESHSGIFHAGGEESLTRVEMGKLYLPLVGISTETIVPVRILDLILGYAVQRNLCLRSEKIKRLFDFSFTPFAEGLRRSITE